MGKLQDKLLTLPTFLLTVFIFWWSPAFMAYTYTVKFLQFRGPRTDMYNWGKFMKSLLGVRVLKLGSGSLYKGAGPILYLANHRSWADFFLDIYLTEGNAALMSRWLVFYVFPVFMSVVIVLKGIVLFKRGTIADKQKFNAWLDSKLKGSHVPGLLVYPEGHRSIKPVSLPLKRGMLHYAHSRGMPVQIVMSAGKEGVMSEKRMRVRIGATIVVTYSEVIQSAGTEFEAFFSQLQATWDKKWAEVFAADPTGLPPLVQDSIPGFDYDQGLRKRQCIAISVSALLLLATVALIFKASLAVAAVVGPLATRVILTTMAGWLVASIWASRASS